jgi:hypothetical protein
MEGVKPPTTEEAASGGESRQSRQLDRPDGEMGRDGSTCERCTGEVPTVSRDGKERGSEGDGSLPGAKMLACVLET